MQHTFVKNENGEYQHYIYGIKTNAKVVRLSPTKWGVEYKGQIIAKHSSRKSAMENITLHVTETVKEVDTTSKFIVGGIYFGGMTHNLYKVTKINRETKRISLASMDSLDDHPHIYPWSLPLRESNGIEYVAVFDDSIAPYTLVATEE